MLRGWSIRKGAGGGVEPSDADGDDVPPAQVRGAKAATADRAE
jgi:hypothetical protein